MMIDIGIIGGLGAFGQFLTERIREVDRMGLGEGPTMVKSFDMSKSSPYSLESALESHAVIFAVPPRKYEVSMRKVIPLMRKDTIIVDVCTVKMHTVKLLRELCDGRPYLACHPMFGPQGFTDNDNSLRGLDLVVCEHTLPKPMYRWLENLLTDRLGLKIEKMSADEHDRIQAEEQLLTQHFGTIVREAGFARSAGGAHTVSSKHFYTAMEIVANDGALFEDVCELNPFWPEVEARFELAVAARRLATVKRKNGKH